MGKNDLVKEMIMALAVAICAFIMGYCYCYLEISERYKELAKKGKVEQEDVPYIISGNR